MKSTWGECIVLFFIIKSPYDWWNTRKKRNVVQVSLQNSIIQGARIVDCIRATRANQLLDLFGKFVEARRIWFSSCQRFDWSSTLLLIQLEIDTCRTQSSSRVITFLFCLTVLHGDAFILDPANVTAKLVLPVGILDEFGLHRKSPHLIEGGSL